MTDRKNVFVFLLVLLMCLPLFATSVNAANTVTIYAPSKDTYIQGGSQYPVYDVNQGLNAMFDVGASSKISWTARGLVQFNLPSEVSGKTIISAVLELHGATWTNGEPFGLLFRACRVTHDWIEGNGGGGPDNTGATWNQYDKSTPTNNWTTPGGDFTLVGSSTVVWPDQTLEYWLNFTVTSIVQGWAIGSFQNYGFLIKLNDESAPPYNGSGFFSREGAGYPSRLEICYGSTFVVPEVPLGTVIASAAMIMGLLAYFGIPRLPRLNRKR